MVAITLRGNAKVLLREGQSMWGSLESVATPGGITELLRDKLDEIAGLQAWAQGLDAVAKRLKG